MMNNSKKKRPKIVVIGGGTGLPVVLKSLKEKNADVTAIVTVADDGGSSGSLREYFNAVPPGDIRNVLTALSDMPNAQKEVFQYRFDKKDKNFAGHPLGNIIISAMAEMRGNIYEAIQILSRMMMIKGQVYPAAEEPLNLHAVYEDGSIVSGESQIPKAGKQIERVYVTSSTDKKEVKAGRKVVSSILNADMVVLGPGSLYTSILPNLMIPEIGKAVCETSATVVYISNIMTQLGETENFTDANHVQVLHKHLGKKFIDVTLANIGMVPVEYTNQSHLTDYLVQVEHDFKALTEETAQIISDDFLEFRSNGVYHNGEKVAEELYQQAFHIQRNPKNKQEKLP
nr:YvcK family protein [Lacticigenium naphthae]